MNIQQSYREAAVRGASRVQLVVRLYEQIVEDLRQAAIAVEQNAIERQSKRIKHAILVIGHLQSSLDFEKGGKVAHDLNHFYDVLRQNLVQVQFQPSRRALTQQITDLLVLREAWIQVERAEDPPVTTNPREVASGAAGADTMHMDWNG
ncbi:MAG: flagellar export chaperone FliS [Terriglobales bacterium]